MKKIFTILAFAAAMVGCKDIYGPTPEPRVPEESKGITVAVLEAKDSSLTVNFAPKEAGVYFSYIIRQEDKVAALDSAAVYDCSASGAVACEVYIDGKKVAAEAKGALRSPEFAAPITFKALKPHTTYVIYAVAASTTGLISPVVAQVATTTDGEAPALKEFKAEENVVTLTFSEDVKYVTGKKVVARTYPGYRYVNATQTAYVYPYLDGPYEQAPIEGKVTVAGNVATVTFQNMFPGTYYGVNYEEGTFVDAVDQPCAAIAGAFKKGAPTTACYGYTAYASVPATAPTIKTIVEYDRYLEFESKTPLLHAYTPKELAQLKIDTPTFTISHKDSQTGISSDITYPLDGADDYAIDGNKFLLKLNVEPERGDQVSINIPAGVFIDVYGNASPAYKFEKVLYSYGLTVDDVIGTYMTDGKSVYNGYDENPAEYIIAKSNNASKGNVMITSAYGLEGIKIYATFDGDLGVLTFKQDDESCFAGTFQESANVWVDYYIGGYYGWYKEQQATSNLYMTEPGVFSDFDDYFGYYYQAFTDPKVRTQETYIGGDYNFFLHAPVKSTDAPAATCSAAPANGTKEAVTFRRVR